MKLLSPTCRLWVLLALSMVCFFSPEHVASQDDTQEQFWPELDVFHRLDARWRLFGFTSVTRAREIQYTDWTIAAHVDFSFDPILPFIGVRASDFERFRSFMLRAGTTSAGRWVRPRGTIWSIAAFSKRHFALR